MKKMLIAIIVTTLFGMAQNASASPVGDAIFMSQAISTPQGLLTTNDFAVQLPDGKTLVGVKHCFIHDDSDNSKVESRAMLLDDGEPLWVNILEDGDCSSIELLPNLNPENLSVRFMCKSWGQESKTCDARVMLYFR